jgi:hypothetical protein
MEFGSLKCKMGFKNIKKIFSEQGIAKTNYIF